ncbi:phosphoribosylglycinamide formyltransferase [Saccharata proteae CBS 121410]|uniref:Phosphoribosylglycinamide formyltransferase n=1 Tax=Saccharata proteae CBS 121410 TaxID=1314787 RepID=A0A9P4HQ95_9PEZI|nr:phosphoribosylglycinamide formyltransferase [Saccharata proteae CBS 121410]
MSEKHHTRITVLISGSGTNLQALIDACKDGRIPNTSIIRVISNKKDVGGIHKARAAGILDHFHSLPACRARHPELSPTEQREKFDAELAEVILKDKPDLVVCAGYMLVMSNAVLDPLIDAKVPIINLHPALPGEYNGIKAIERAHADWRAGKISRTGVMIHYVIREVDMGTPILTKEIPFVPGEDDELDPFETKLHKVEWQAIVEGTVLAIRKLWAERGEDV